MANAWVGNDLRCKYMMSNFRNAAVLQDLEISQVVHDMGGRVNKTVNREKAAQDFCEAILALQLTSLTLRKVDCGGQILPDKNIGSLAMLRCVFPLSD